MTIFVNLPTINNIFRERQNEKLLVIPLMNNQKTASALASLRNLQSVLKNDPDKTNPQDKQTEFNTSCSSTGINTIEERVIREIMNEVDEQEQATETPGKSLKLPMIDNQILNGANEPSIDDYDHIPIEQFGVALLRGMGLTDQEIVSRESMQPDLRPKGKTI